MASQEFDVFITADQNLENQLNPANYEIGIIVLRAPTNRLADHDPLIPGVLQQLNSIQTGTVIRIGRE